MLINVCYLLHINTRKLCVQSYSKIRYNQTFHWVQFPGVQVEWELECPDLVRGGHLDSKLEGMNLSIQSHFALFSHSYLLPLSLFGLEYSSESMTKYKHSTFPVQI